MGLYAQPPSWMLQTVVHGGAGIRFQIFVIAGLQEEILKIEIAKLARLCRILILRIHQLQFAARSLYQQRIRFRADAQPVNSIRRRYRAVCFHADFKTGCSASIAPVSSCNSGSPPVQTTYFELSAAASGHAFVTAFASDSAATNLPPPGPSVPTKSVSQNLQTASTRCCSRPDHRLQPENRRNTAARPVCAPSPCKVK